MKDSSRVLALSLYIPNCDKKGFFKRKQVVKLLYIFTQCKMFLKNSSKKSNQSAHLNNVLIVV